VFLRHRDNLGIKVREVQRKVTFSEIYLSSRFQKKPSFNIKDVLWLLYEQWY